ncbi:MAG: hypothetical protein MZV70_39555 [Desulfobacterales bacterium]|nr:hypothetical protein [Desulfobacterales bacterium]
MVCRRIAQGQRVLEPGGGRRRPRPRTRCSCSRARRKARAVPICDRAACRSSDPPHHRGSPASTDDTDEHEPADEPGRACLRSWWWRGCRKSGMAAAQPGDWKAWQRAGEGRAGGQHQHCQGGRRPVTQTRSAHPARVTECP